MKKQRGSFRVANGNLIPELGQAKIDSIGATNKIYMRIMARAAEVTKALGFGKFDYDDCLKEGTGSQQISIETLCKGVERGFNDFNQNEAGNSSSTALGGQTA